jgi:hypothetical protein
MFGIDDPAKETTTRHHQRHRHQPPHATDAFPRATLAELVAL